jgi:SEC-C motif-containing protein
MRSRYVAYTRHESQYLLDTWHPETRPSTLLLDDQQRWLGLRIKRAEDGQPGDTTGLVEFVARYKIAGRGFRLHEVSRFVYIDGKWFYVDGDFPKH